MSVDLQATKAKVMFGGRSISGWARSVNRDPEHMRKAFMNPPKVKLNDKDIAALKKAGFLVMKKKGGDSHAE
jgi:hypothetical protein